jgi:hypothetical protein
VVPIRRRQHDKGDAMGETEGAVRGSAIP